MQIGEWVLRKPAPMRATWPTHIKIAVNLSPVQFRSRTSSTTVSARLAVAALPPNRLELEITESVLLQDDDTTLRLLRQLRALGVGSRSTISAPAIPSLSYLQRFPFDKIKIDQSFVRGIADPRKESPRDRARHHPPCRQSRHDHRSPKAWRPPSSLTSCGTKAASRRRAICSAVRSAPAMWRSFMRASEA